MTDDRLRSLVATVREHEDRGDLRAARRAADEAEALAAATGDLEARAEALRVLAGLHHRTGAFADAEALYARAYEIDSSRGDAQAASLDLAGRGLALLDRGRVEDAATALERARLAQRQSGDDLGLSSSSRTLARLARLCDETDRARELAEEAVSIPRRLHVARDLALSLCELGHARLAGGAPAAQVLAEARGIAGDLGVRPGSSVDQALQKLEMAEEALHAGLRDRCFRGELLEDIPAGLRRWLERAGRLTGPVDDAPPEPMVESFGPYRVAAILGQGGGGVVYRATHRETGESVAVKTLRLADRRRLLLLRREVRALARLRHPGIVRILSEHIDDDVPWYAMELVDGTPLHEHADSLWDRERAEGIDRTMTLDHLPEEGDAEAVAAPAPSVRPRIPAEALQRMLTIARRLCEALGYLHGEGMVHRDVKPANVVVRPDGTPVLVDLGLATLGGAAGREGLDDAAVRGGTLHYMAPEQMRGELVDARADLYALGVVLYELLAGQPPFDAASVTALVRLQVREPPRPLADHVDGLPPELPELVMRLLAKDPQHRLGHAEDVAAVLRALGAGGPPAPPPPARAYLYQPRVAGRAPALQRIQGAVESLARGTGGFVAIGGESGVGKTRLAMEAARRAADRGFAVLSGECHEQGRPLGAFRRALEAVADRCREGGDAATAELLGPRGALLATYSAALGRIPAVAAAPPPAELPHDAARLRLFLFLAETLEALARDVPLLLLVDDLQWADELSLGALAFLVRGRLARAPLLVVGTFRSEEAGPQLLEVVQAKEASWITLDRLDDAGIARMVSDMLALDPPPEAFARDLARQSSGNPFFVAEYLRAAVQEGLLWRDRDGHWQLAGAATGGALPDGARLPLPQGLRGLVERRLHALPAEARRIGDAVAVLGGEGRPRLVARVAGVDDDELMLGLSELLQRHVLVERDGGRVAFAHDQIREIAYDRLEPAPRAALHRAAALLLSTSPFGDPPVDLGWHWEGAGEPERALEAYRQSARRAIAAHAHAEAERHLRASLRLARDPSPTSVELENDLGVVLETVGRTAEARAEHSRACEGARLLADRRLLARSLRHLGVLAHESGNLPEARALLEEAVDAIRGLGEDRTEAEVVRSLANVLVHQGEGAEAERLYGLALELSRRAGSALGEAVALGAIGVMHFEHGDLDRARPLLEEAVALKREVGDRRGAALTLGNLGALHARQGRLAEARQAYDEALRFKRDTGDRRGEAVVLGNIAALEHDQGRIEEALALFQRCRAIHRELGSHRVEGIMMANVGAALSGLGRLAEAEAAYAEALGIHRAVGNRRSEAIALTMLGDILHMSGRLAEAETSFQEALRLHRELGSVRDEATTLRGLSELRRNLGDASAAEELAADAAAKLRRVKDGVELGLALCALGHAALASGRPASGPLAEAEGLAEALGMGDASSVRKAIARLRRAAARAAESGSEALWRGQCREDVRPEVLGEGDPEHRGTLP